MTKHDIDVASAVGILAKIVNQASRVVRTESELVPMVLVPRALLYEAKRLLGESFKGTEYGSKQVNEAYSRLLE